MEWLFIRLTYFMVGAILGSFISYYHGVRKIRKIHKDLNILTGKDAERFTEEMENPTPISKEKLEKMKESYELLKKCERF